MNQTTLNVPAYLHVILCKDGKIAGPMIIMKQVEVLCSTSESELPVQHYYCLWLELPSLLPITLVRMLEIDFPAKCLA